MRAKVRIRNHEKIKLVKAVEATVLPELKEFLNSLPLRDRIKAAWRLLLGRF